MGGLLPSGKVFVTGGTDSSANALASSEIFDPSSGTWAVGPDMSGGRVGAVAVTLQNGDVLVAGGEAGGSGAPPDTGEVYDPGTDTFTPVGNTMSDERFESMASLLPDGDVLIAGGSGAGGPTQSADLYDPATNLFLTGAAAPPPMSTPRQDAEAITLSNGDVLVAGGIGDDTAELYDPAANTWTATANAMSTPRAAGGIAPLPAGRVLLAGGEDLSGNAIASTDICDPVTNTFTAGPPLNVGRLGFGMVSLPDGDVLAAGGLDRGAVPPPIFAGQTEIYDSSHNRWSLTDNVVQPAFELTMTRLGNGQVLAAGGVVNIFGQATGTTEVFTPPRPPAAPGDVSATASDGSAQVTFAPPSSDNGAPVTGYTVTASTGQSASTPDGRTVATVTGLRNGTPVTFIVVATNAEGTGPASAPSSAVTPTAPETRTPVVTAPAGAGSSPDKAATLRLSGLLSRTTLKRFLQGLRFGVTPSKAAALQITLSATASGAVISRFDLTLASKSLRLAGGTRTVKLVPSRKLVGHPRAAKVRLTVVAIDAAGTRSQVTRTVTIKG